ncbi:MAG: hypothetical protein J6J64_07445 [Alistipes sp.]|nr:hypothetical protein [Alistipes sp.]
MKHIDDIKQLVERFLEGRTTNAEEHELYEWFATADVPEEWSDLKAMFAWYAAGMPEESAAPARRKLRPARELWVGWAAGVAAVVAIAVLIFREDEPRRPIDIYEGSFIIAEGVRYDEPAYIEQEIEALLLRADAIEQKADDLLAWAEL